MAIPSERTRNAPIQSNGHVPMREAVWRDASEASLRHQHRKAWLNGGTL